MTSAEDFGWAMERFLSEARTLAQFEHPNVVRVINVFERKRHRLHGHAL
ncbi:MAG: hypothetical protein U5P41_00365 [Gammaproteobacteria bacterium]|nr:hypothetical protein [Gammaproteobacteria bacterium]